MTEPTTKTSQLPQHMKKAACVVLRSFTPGEIVVVETNKHGFATVGLPGGKVEEGESFVRAASRELFEETGILVKPPNLSLLLEEEFLSPRTGSLILCQTFQVSWLNADARRSASKLRRFTTSEGVARLGRWSELISSQSSIYHAYNEKVLLAVLGSRV